MSPHRHCLISLDGLAIQDWRALLDLLPEPSCIDDSFSAHELVGNNLSAAQSIWAEILTAETWFVNGCTGYARPTKSLNALSVVSEADLFARCRLVENRSDDKTAVIINVPLLLPRPDRIWLSDGSLTLNKVFSPSKLSESAQFASYEPRPFSDIVANQESSSSLANRCLEVERMRLECARSLLAQEDWSVFILRVTAFDHLAHLLGLNYLRASDLKVFPAIRQLAHELSKFIQLAHSLTHTNVSILSAYSHIACRGTINLNSLLERGGFLKIDGGWHAERDKEGRIKAASALLRGKIGSYMFASMEGRLLTTATTAASPVAGCVFVNRKNVFQDGIVEDVDYDGFRSQLKMYLEKTLSKTYGSRCKIEGNQLSPNEAGIEERAIPEFVISIDGIEFHNMQETGGQVYNAPRTTHIPSGFILFPKGLLNSPSIATTEINGILTAESASI